MCSKARRNNHLREGVEEKMINGGRESPREKRRLQLLLI